MSAIAARRVSVRVLVVLATVLLAAATVAAYAWRVVFDTDRFVDRATTALQDPSVRDVIAERVTDDLVLPREPDLLAARPIIASAVSGIVGGDAFASLFRRGVRDAHRTLFRTGEGSVTLTLVDVGIVVSAAARELDPELAARLESGGGRIEVLSRDIGSVTGDVARRARQLRVLAIVLAVLALAAGAGALLLARDRRRAVAGLGIGLVVAGVTVAIADTVARSLVLDRVTDPDERAAAGAVWDAFLGDLRTTGWLIAGVGAVVAAAAASLIRPVDVEGPLRAAWRVATTEPATPALRLARGAALVGAGVLAIAQPATVLRVAVTLAGVYVLYKGVEAIMRVLARPASAAADRPDRPERRRRSPRVAVSVLAALLIGTAVAAFAGTGGVDEPAPTITRCNGHAALCDRPLNEVTFPATHNSMSVPLPGWFSSLQERPIGGQLEDGIRGLLFDTHYADRLANGRTRTYFASADDLRDAIQQDGVSEQSAAAALRLRARLGFRGEGERGVYLCHTFCELGSTPLGDVLDDIHEFLVTHPAEVLVIINQDAITPEDFVRAMDDAGLGRYAITPPEGSAWPTLRRLIEQDRRLLVLAEEQAGAAPWYQLAYERLTQETPFTFAAARELTDPAELPASCEPNRGTAGAPLFLLNHWVNTDPVPRPAHATLVNAYDALLRRARTCARLRGRRVNLLAVDFYKRGDVFRVADTLNGA